MTEVGPTMNNVYGSRSSSLARARRPTSERTKMRDLEEGTGASQTRNQPTFEHTGPGDVSYPQG